MPSLPEIVFSLCGIMCRPLRPLIGSFPQLPFFDIILNWLFSVHLEVSCSLRASALKCYEQTHVQNKPSSYSEFNQEQCVLGSIKSQSSNSKELTGQPS